MAAERKERDRKGGGESPRPPGDPQRTLRKNTGARSWIRLPLETEAQNEETNVLALEDTKWSDGELGSRNCRLHIGDTLCICGGHKSLGSAIPSGEKG